MGYDKLYLCPSIKIEKLNEFCAFILHTLDNVLTNEEKGKGKSKYTMLLNFDDLVTKYLVLCKDFHLEVKF